MPGPIWLAIDTQDVAAARALAAACRPWLGGVKLGLEFFVANGPVGVRQVTHDLGLPLFLDLKLHDIPNTVAKAVASASALAPALLTVHAAGGAAMMAAARAAAGPATRIIAVTVLTSLDAADLSAAGIFDSPPQQVARLAALAAEAGIDGLVCSAHDLADARQAWPAGFFVVPGVRPAGHDHHDQKRVMTPAAALNAGADALVIGRPISEAIDPAVAAAAIAADL